MTLDPCGADSGGRLGAEARAGAGAGRTARAEARQVLGGFWVGARRVRSVI
ncbi:hypothetical protein [Frankia sp. EI5c]|uniref:hypothetical protein n=1 Tax=Frankia sp. EI5c TaxID=683316 RepID=UPI000AA344A8|nr:hypothetical protein [Frankia sp. EI5c]